MKFGPVPPRQAEGATAVHTIRQGSLVLKKGTLIGACRGCGAGGGRHQGCGGGAARTRRRVRGQGRGRDRQGGGGAGRARRSRLHRPRQSVCAGAGVLVVDKEAIDRLNRVDEAITFATLPAFKPVVEGEMIATVKIIPFATSEASLKGALAAAGKPFIRVAPYTIKKVGVVSTLVAGPRHQGGREDLAGDAGSPDAGRRQHRRRAPRAARAGRGRQGGR